MITLAKRGDLAARRAVVAAVPERAARRQQAVRRDRPQVRRPHVGLHPDRPDRPAPGRCRADRPDRAGLAAPMAPERTPRGRPVRYRATGRIRRNGLRRVPGAAWGPDGPGRARGRAGPPERRGPPARSTGPAEPTPGCTPTGQVIAFTYPGRLRRRSWVGRSTRSSRPDVAIRDLRRDHGEVPPTLRGAVPGVPLHRLERAAKPASRAHGARGAGPARHRRDGASRVGPRGPARLLAPSGRRTGTRSGPCTRSGSGGADRS